MSISGNAKAIWEWIGHLHVATWLFELIRGSGSWIASGILSVIGLLWASIARENYLAIPALLFTIASLIWIINGVLWYRRRSATSVHGTMPTRIDKVSDILVTVASEKARTNTNKLYDQTFEQYQITVTVRNGADHALTNLRWFSYHGSVATINDKAPNSLNIDDSYSFQVARFTQGVGASAPGTEMEVFYEIGHPLTSCRPLNLYEFKFRITARETSPANFGVRVWVEDGKLRYQKLQDVSVP